MFILYICGILILFIALCLVFFTERHNFHFEKDKFSKLHSEQKQEIYYDLIHINMLIEKQYEMLGNDVTIDSRKLEEFMGMCRFVSWSTQ